MERGVGIRVVGAIVRAAGLAPLECAGDGRPRGDNCGARDSTPLQISEAGDVRVHLQHRAAGLDLIQLRKGLPQPRLRAHHGAALPHRVAYGPLERATSSSPFCSSSSSTSFAAPKTALRSRSCPSSLSENSPRRLRRSGRRRSSRSASSRRAGWRRGARPCTRRRRTARRRRWRGSRARRRCRPSSSARWARPPSAHA